MNNKQLKVSFTFYLYGIVIQIFKLYYIQVLKLYLIKKLSNLYQNFKNNLKTQKIPEVIPLQSHILCKIICTAPAKMVKSSELQYIYVHRKADKLLLSLMRNKKNKSLPAYGLYLQAKTLVGHISLPFLTI